MTFKRFFCISSPVIFFLMFGCATAYQAKGFRGGYNDIQLDENTFRVSFRGNGFTSQDTVITYLLYRCAEITRRQKKTILLSLIAHLT